MGWRSLRGEVMIYFTDPYPNPEDQEMLRTRAGMAMGRAALNKTR